MRISLFTGRSDDLRRALAVESAATIAAEHRAIMLVLPGDSLGRGKADASVLQQLADKTNVSILAEVTHTFFFRPNQFSVGPFIQCFATGTHATYSRVQEVTQGFITGKRIVTVGQKSIGVLLCGENNILRNARKNNNEPRPRYPEVVWPLNYDVLVNPAHTSMGQWNLLHKRFAYFSQSGRTALYCTNNRHSSWKTSLCVYQDGKKLVMGDFSDANALQTHVAGNWRLATINIP